MEFTKKNIRTILLLILFTALTFKVVNNPALIIQGFRAITSLLFPFLIGIIAAMIMNIPMRFFEGFIVKKRGEKGEPPIWIRVLSLVLTLLLFGGLIFLVAFFMIPSAYDSLMTILSELPDYVDTLRGFLNRHGLPSEFLPELASNSIEDIVLFIQGFWNSSSSSGWISSLLPIVTSFFGNLINFLLGLVFSIYILMQKERIVYFTANACHAFLPEKIYRKCAEIARHTGATFGNFLTGQCLDAFILASMMLIAMLICKIPFAPLIALLIFVCALIPIFGAWISAAIAVVLIFTQSWFKALLFAILYIVIQQIDNNFIYPRIVGKSVGLPGVLVLLAVTVGTNAFGLLGAIFSVPICAVLFALFKELVVYRLDKKGVSNVQISTENIFEETPTEIPVEELSIDDTPAETAESEKDNDTNK